MTMPTFDTPEPIAVTLQLGIGDVRIVAGDRLDTVVDVQPSDPTKASDLTAARQTRIAYANGTLVVEAPKGWRQWTPWGGQQSIDVRIQLPSGSSVRGSAGVAGLHCSGRIGECRFQTGVGDLTLEEAGSVDFKAGAGGASADVIGGRAEIRTAGAVRIGRIDGPAGIKNSNGDTWIGEITGEARVTAANGAISVDLAREGVSAKTANGDVRLAEVWRGSVVAQSAFGSVEVGVPEGTPVWLDLETRLGHVRNDLNEAEPPGPGEGSVEIHAHTSMGDVTVHRVLATSRGRNEP
jgi:hypothetical protein